MSADNTPHGAACLSCSSAASATKKRGREASHREVSDDEKKIKRNDLVVTATPDNFLQMQHGKEMLSRAHVSFSTAASTTSSGMETSSETGKIKGQDSLAEPCCHWDESSLSSGDDDNDDDDSDQDGNDDDNDNEKNPSKNQSNAQNKMPSSVGIVCPTTKEKTPFFSPTPTEWESVRAFCQSTVLKEDQRNRLAWIQLAMEMKVEGAENMLRLEQRRMSRASSCS